MEVDIEMREELEEVENCKKIHKGKAVGGRSTAFFLEKKKFGRLINSHFSIQFNYHHIHSLVLITAVKMAGQQKRSRASDASEKVPRSSDKRRRTSDAQEVQVRGPKKARKSDASTAVEKKAAPEKKVAASSPVPWSFSRPVGGRYSNLDPLITDDEA